MTLDDAGVAFIVKEEGCPEHPYWPGGASGVTIGIGYDLGYHTANEFVGDWLALDEPTRSRLALCCGSKADTARALVSDATIRNLVIPIATAQSVFQDISLPKYCGLTETAFPGVGGLCPAAQAALVSLIYNRGASMQGDRRTEMRAIVPLVAAQDYAGIASQLTLMGDRLWPHQPLAARRHREAALVLSCQEGS